MGSWLNTEGARRNAKIHSRSWENMPKNSEMDPRILRKSVKIHNQIDPKCSQNEWVGTKREEREEGTKEERKKGRRGKKDKREENHVRDLTRQGPEAWRII